MTCLLCARPEETLSRHETRVWSEAREKERVSQSSAPPSGLGVCVWDLGKVGVWLWGKRVHLGETHKICRVLWFVLNKLLSQNLLTVALGCV